jgi:hypothetical protein
MVVVFGELFKENLVSGRKKLFYQTVRLFVGFISCDILCQINLQATLASDCSARRIMFPWGTAAMPIRSNSTAVTLPAKSCRGKIMEL